jgi:long-chain acyl-CoA synthetase
MASTPPTAATHQLPPVARTAARLSKQVELALGDVELSLSQYRALAFLSRGTLSPSMLAGRLAVTRPTITALIDGLVQRGLVERRSDPDDGRRAQHQLTTAGGGALARADGAVGERLGRLLDHLPEGDRAAAVEGLLLWSTAIDAQLAAEDRAAEDRAVEGRAAEDRGAEAGAATR